MDQQFAQNQKIKPDKFLAAIIFLSISYGLEVLNVVLFLFKKYPYALGDNVYITSNFILLNLFALVWLTTLVWKGHNWARFYLLFYLVISNPSTVYHFYYKLSSEPIVSLYNFIHLVFMIVGLYLLFCKDTSTWFKQTKKRERKKTSIGRNFFISSICFYIAWGVGVLDLLIHNFGEYFAGTDVEIIYIFQIFFSVNLIFMLVLLVVKTGTLNILFIHTIGKGSKLAGLIYIALTILDTSYTYFLFLGDITTFQAPIISLLYLKILIQIVASIILFQKEIMYILHINKKTKLQR
jgi:hypothetical protein